MSSDACMSLVWGDFVKDFESFKGQDTEGRGQGRELRLDIVGIARLSLAIAVMRKMLMVAENGFCQLNSFRPQNMYISVSSTWIRSFRVCWFPWPTVRRLLA